MFKKTVLALMIISVLIYGGVVLADSNFADKGVLAEGIYSIMTPSITSTDKKVVITDDLKITWNGVSDSLGYTITLTDSKGNSQKFNSKNASFIITKDNFKVGEVYDIGVQSNTFAKFPKKANQMRVLFTDDTFQSSGSVALDVSSDIEKPIEIARIKTDKPIILGKAKNDYSEVTDKEYFTVAEALASVGKGIDKVDYYADKIRAEDDKLSVSEEIVKKEIPKSERWSRVFPDGCSYTSASEAAPHIVTVEIPAWNIGSDGEKYATTYSLQVNENLADEVVQIFIEIFNDEEKFPIKCIGGWRWSYLASGNLSQHNYGTCIDINPDENFMIRADGTIEYPGFWKPYENPYSITPDGSVIRVFRKYGWTWGGADWTSSHDYMHMSYLGG